MWRPNSPSVKTNFILSVSILLAISIVFNHQILASQDERSVALLDINKSILKKELPGKWGHDPFSKRPGFNDEKNSPVTLILNAVFLSEDEKMAIINEIEVYEGTFFEGHLVQTIGKNYVILRKNHYLKELNLPVFENQASQLTIKESTSHATEKKDN